MKIATWNVNSLNVRLPHVLDWLEKNPVEVLCLQETKQQDADFPHAALLAAGYHTAFSGQSRLPLAEVQAGIPHHEDEQKRVIAATIGGIRVVCVYVPNGQAVESDKYYYKLGWLQTLREWLAEELQRYPKLVLLGDYNIAPEDRDVHDPIVWQGNILVSEAERIQYRQLVKLGLFDSFRLFEQADKSFTWWDYRMMAFRRNHGVRIDHILISEPLVSVCKSCVIDREPRKRDRPSDHTPIIAEFDA
jgi:exodeoxyribonuclease-3